MKGTFPGRCALLIAPALIWLGVPATAQNQEKGAFDAEIGQAKSMMMADSSMALEHAQKAAELVSGDGEEAQQARLTAQWLEGEALMRLNRADEAAQTIRSAISEITLNFPGSKLHADLLRSDASLKVSMGQYGEALSSYLEAHELFDAPVFGEMILLHEGDRIPVWIDLKTLRRGQGGLVAGNRVPRPRHIQWLKVPD